MKEYYLRITSLCNLDCEFCESRAKKINFDFNKYIKFIYLLKRNNYTKIIFSGGEPTLYLKELSTLVSISKKLGFSVGLQTNAFTSSSVIIAKKIVGLGFEDIIVSFHSHILDDFDFLYNRKGAYNYVFDGLKKLLFFGGNVYINIVINKINSKYLGDIVLFIQREFHGVKGISLSPIEAISEKRNTLLVSKTLLFNTIVNVLNNVYSIPIFVNWQSIPYCIRGLKYGFDKNFFNDSFLYNYTHLKICNLCKYKKVCKGVDKNYLYIYGEGEFSPIF